MPKFKVTVREYTAEVRKYEVLAETPEAAQELGLALADDDETGAVLEYMDERDAEVELIPEVVAP